MLRRSLQDSTQPSLYRIEAKEQSRSNWVVFRQPQRGSGGHRQIRPRYAGIVCPSCERFDSDAVFNAGFDSDVSIHVRDDFAETSDYLFVISQKVLDVLRRGRVRGYKVKKVGKAGWYAMQATLRVESYPRVFSYERTRCKACGRPLDGGGLHELLAQIEPPAVSNTFFTTKLHCLAREGPDRDLFCTEDVALLLKAHGIRKGSLHRLWTREEKRTRDAKEKEDIFNWYPPKQIIWL